MKREYPPLMSELKTLHDSKAVDVWRSWDSTSGELVFKGIRADVPSTGYVATSKRKTHDAAQKDLLKKLQRHMQTKKFLTAQS